ncbi:hypothetical protein CLAFUW4_11188 [Fulvia fulva]|uniref:Uncharacterized protein n=1 Tax=Passalora fulva TaxID=5499 RepID=A0A9Q8URZ8_PASFU|nr:uncharacterized protein CLAFUR5_10231 [Fulvia fulva]KAK4620048.1 hypothetical protein CLAFUR4_11193 [Fulvia fulva]KAK4620762.1 hypothetical protein CLAFUR0_11198 [Fulvia fulva]UJO20247.1 hypothetical protein CLAFUR5_10231 [Fulvia fulva]WPV17464.1 hypothetical protein CLAFUW4_11188 [Fulvia fulva]WPV31946.1 hypothetical protein CLAFUW7_11184 [Fulvia fulva]
MHVSKILAFAPTLALAAPLAVEKASGVRHDAAAKPDDAYQWASDSGYASFTKRAAEKKEIARDAKAKPDDAYDWASDSGYPVFTKRAAENKAVARDAKAKPDDAYQWASDSGYASFTKREAVQVEA